MGIVSVLIIDPSVEPPTNNDSEDASPVSPEDKLADAKLLYYFPSESTAADDRRTASSIFRGIVEFAMFCGNNQVGRREDEFFKVKSSNVYTVMKFVEPNILLVIVFDLIESDWTAENLFNRFYETYYLLHGLIGSKSNLTDTFEDFIPSFVSAETVIGEESSFTLNGLRYAPIERHGFVAMHAVGLEILAEHENDIFDFFILFSGHLVSMSFCPDTFRPLYNYLVMNMRDGSVDNAKLSLPPFGRIGTPAALPLGGLSSYGRTNKFDTRAGWLFGPTGEGECVFCPHVFLNGDTNGTPLAVYVSQELLFGFTLKSTNPMVFKKLEKFISDNNELNKEIIPIIRNDFALSLSVSAAEDDEPLKYVYHNKVNQSGMFSKSGKTQMNQPSAAKKLLRSATSLLYPFTGTPPLESPKHGRKLKGRIQELMAQRPDVCEIAVKRSVHQGWSVGKRSQSGREIYYEFKNPRVPLWKALTEIEQFNTSRFNSVYI